MNAAVNSSLVIPASKPGSKKVAAAASASDLEVGTGSGTNPMLQQKVRAPFRFCRKIRRSRPSLDPGSSPGMTTRGIGRAGGYQSRAVANLLLDHIVAGKRGNLRQHPQKRIAIVRADARDNARVVLFLQALQLFQQPAAGVR